MIEDIIKDLEDKEITVLNFSKSLIELVDEQLNEYYSIYFKYHVFDECKDIFDEFGTSSKYIKKHLDAVTLIDNQNIESKSFFEEFYKALENVGGFDFNSIKYSIPYKTDELTITSTVIAYCISGNIEILRALYEDENYLNLPAEVRYNNDRYLIDNLLNDELMKFIRFNNFKVNDYTISYLAEKYIDEYRNYVESEREEGREDIQLEIERVKKAILSKASNKEEVRNYTNYINKLQRKIGLGYEMLEQEADNDENKDEYDSEYDDYEVSSKINRIQKLVNSNPHGMKY